MSSSSLTSLSWFFLLTRKSAKRTNERNNICEKKQTPLSFRMSQWIIVSDAKRFPFGRILSDSCPSSTIAAPLFQTISSYFDKCSQHAYWILIDVFCKNPKRRRSESKIDSSQDLSVFVEPSCHWISCSVWIMIALLFFWTSQVQITPAVIERQ